MAEKAPKWRMDCVDVIKSAMQGENDPEKLRDMGYALGSVLPTSPPTEAQAMPVRVVSGKKPKKSRMKRTMKAMAG
jgi:hypothetical protein